MFLCLAALYESWSIPFSVMLVVPLGVLGGDISDHARAGETTSTSRWACSPP
ncbi:efflux RND transporter permease subunit [Escherichia coli]